MGNQQSPAVPKNSHYNEIEIKVKIEKKDVNKTIYFLDNTITNTNNENSKKTQPSHSNLKELNKFNTTLIIDEKKVTKLEFIQ